MRLDRGVSEVRSDLSPLPQKGSICLTLWSEKLTGHGIRLNSDSCTSNKVRPIGQDGKVHFSAEGNHLHRGTLHTIACAYNRK